jgi:RNA polymerase sigma-70 factor, ECF subfamily
MGGEARNDFVTNLSKVQPALRGFALALTGSFADAEDLIQETNLVLWSKAAEFDSSKPLVGWALGIARNIAKNSQRKWKGLALCADNQLLERLSERFSVLSNEIDARQEHLRECVEKLPARQKQILLSRYEDSGDDHPGHPLRPIVVASCSHMCKNWSGLQVLLLGKAGINFVS